MSTITKKEVIKAAEKIKKYCKGKELECIKCPFDNLNDGCELTKVIPEYWKLPKDK